MNNSAIYEPKGPAREYCGLAMNHYTGCTHRCLYCYVPMIRHLTKEEFHRSAVPRLTRDEISVSAAAIEGNNKPVFLSFTSDPYQRAEEEYGLTRYVIQTLHEYDHPVAILTKGGTLAQCDFDLYRKDDSFGVTLTFTEKNKSKLWEPGAARPEDRLNNLMEAHKAGIKTWVSLEPVIVPIETIALIHMAAPYTDHFKVGKLNYHESPFPVDWKLFAEEAIRAFRFEHRGFYIKKSLAAYIGHPEGYAEGTQLP